MKTIKESDWKFLSELRKTALDRYCERVLAEIEEVKSDETENFHQRYRAIYAIVARRDKELALVFDDHRRSTAILEIAALKARGLLKDDEFIRFSQETRAIVEAMLENRA